MMYDLGFMNPLKRQPWLLFCLAGLKKNSNGVHYT